jgi:hypothetical protein
MESITPKIKRYRWFKIALRLGTKSFPPFLRMGIAKAYGNSPSHGNANQANHANKVL